MKTNRKEYEPPNMTRHDGLVEIAKPVHEPAQSSATKPAPPPPPPPAPKDR